MKQQPDLYFLVSERDRLLSKTKYFDYDSVYKAKGDYIRRQDLNQLDDVISMIREVVSEQAA